MITRSTAAFYASAQRQMNALRQRGDTLQQQVGSGKRLTRSSDDPVAAARLRELARAERSSGADKRNMQIASTNLALADSALSQMANVVIRAKELALQAGGATLSQADRKAIGIEVSALRDSLFALANARDASGHALFGGTVPGTAFTRSGNAITYAGSQQPPALDIGGGQSVQRGFAGPQVLGEGDADLFATLAQLANGLAAGAAPPASTLEALDSGLERITTAQTNTGTRIAFLDMIDDRRLVAGEQRAQERDAIGGADLAQTIASLQQTMTVLEVSQSSFVKLASLSLFKFLR